MKQAILIVTLFMLFSVPAMAQDKVVVIPLFKSVPAGTSKLIFVTNGLWSGNLGGLSGADDKCNAEAKIRGFRGKFQALLGSTAGRPLTRSIHYPIPYVSETANYLQSDFHDLFNSGPDNPVNADPYKHAWTGLNSNGTLSGQDCNGWTDSSNSNTGSKGKVDAIGATWLNDLELPYACNGIFNLYCIEQ